MERTKSLVALNIINVKSTTAHQVENECFNRCKRGVPQTFFSFSRLARRVVALFVCYFVVRSMGSQASRLLHGGTKTKGVCLFQNEANDAIEYSYIAQYRTTVASTYSSLLLVCTRDTYY